MSEYYRVTIEISNIREDVYDTLLEKIEDVCVDSGAKYFSHIGEPDDDANEDYV